MFRFYMMLALKEGNVPNAESMTRVFKCNVTAPSELAARRQALEQAWSNGLRVTSITISSVRNV